jgi:MFS family permease
LFSGIGGLIPSTLFAMAVHFAPDMKSNSASVGWVMQWSAVGQFSGPPLLGFLASQMGSWNYSWWITSVASTLGLLLSYFMSREFNK